jgi:excisionase family DNA binding protein
MEDQLTTAEAAELLNVSQPFVLKKLEAGELPFHMAGTQQGLRLVDVLAYRDRTSGQKRLSRRSPWRPKRWACAASSRETRVEPSAVGVPWIRATTADRER